MAEMRAMEACILLPLTGVRYSIRAHMLLRKDRAQISLGDLDHSQADTFEKRSMHAPSLHHNVEFRSIRMVALPRDLLETHLLTV